MKRTTIDAEFTKKFNSIRMRYCGQKLPKEKLESIFKEELDLKIDSVWLSKLIEAEVIDRVKSGKKKGYTFAYKPVFIEKLKNIHSEVVKTWNHYNRNQKNMKKNAPKEPVTPIVELVTPIMEEVQIVTPIEAAIKLLKDNGYRVFKTVITYQEI